MPEGWKEIRLKFRFLGLDISTTSVKFQGSVGVGTCQDIPSKVKAKLFYLAPPATKIEVQCLVGPFGFWRQNIFHLGVFFNLFTEWSKELLVLNEEPNKKRLFNRCKLCKLACSYDLDYMIDRFNDVWSVSHRRRCSLETLASTWRWITVKDLWLLFCLFICFVYFFFSLDLRLLEQSPAIFCRWLLSF